MLSRIRYVLRETGANLVRNLTLTAASLITVVVSLMQPDHVEVRLVRGAPSSDGGPPVTSGAEPLFAVFNLDRLPGHRVASGGFGRSVDRRDQRALSRRTA